MKEEYVKPEVIKVDFDLYETAVTGKDAKEEGILAPQSEFSACHYYYEE